MAVTSPDDLDTQPLEDHEATSLTPGEQAQLDQMEEGLRHDQPSSRGNGKTGLAKLTGKAAQKSKTKWFVGGAIGGVGLIGMAIFIFFLLLFKNIHIQTLFLDYEFANFNRAFRNRLEQSVDDTEAQPAGSAEST